ncbi:type VI secretion system baseplate subunit TssE [Serratia proteamaculans]|jgi:type VI secretion system protein ImpF|uniref:type VI secretion system baseplate subunit TssE n=1 Tax=Serratia proteamaculans TaxID=28151 RepID=UPI000D9CA7EE|nr:GPW/gp25 family protein [Serratia proteamaculans]SPZ52654.1 type VI secretion system lysozyme-like protein [Serratia quinivorans]CAI0903036.1 type VI secretion system lysozyme-like protein [Serratia proteamaculans]CAI0976249.1 type VI secretion system lysozyme-like protein [Serratia proteamaculans]CAI1061503.1 type VI secretion system lysozyme-like protein [Serratia proteamaculans]CAI1967999.1 type VI secretion system lysozyme-like protein [Serratia proteamaculans]
MKASLPMLFDKLSTKTQITGPDKWRKVIVRDIEFLLNDASRSADLKLYDYRHCENSVLNYGFPSLSQRIPISTDPLTLAKHIQRIITSFEPRLDPKTIRVVPAVNERQSYVLAILFDIYGTCSLPGDEMLVNLRIALDYSCGAVRVFD